MPSIEEIWLNDSAYLDPPHSGKVLGEAAPFKAHMHKVVILYIYVCVHICIHVYNFYPHLYGHLHALVFRIGSSPTGGLSAKASGNDRFRPKKCERRPPNLVESWPTFWGRFLVHKTGLLHVMLQGGPNFGAPKGVHFWDRKFA